MRMRLLAAGLGVAFLVALATLSIRPGEGERIPPPETPSEAPQRSGPEPVVPPDSSPVRSPLGPKSPDAGLARFRGTVEV
ncbi:MAG: hypothetical protein ACREIU_10990, partial [Planctomycetota bacterium]